MTLSTRSSNQVSLLLKHKKSAMSPVTKRRTRKTSAPASSKKSPGKSTPARTLLDYFSPSPSSRKSQSNDLSGRNKQPSSLSAEPCCPEPKSSLCRLSVTNLSLDDSSMTTSHQDSNSVSCLKDKENQEQDNSSDRIMDDWERKDSHSSGKLKHKSYKKIREHDHEVNSLDGEVVLIDCEPIIFNWKITDDSSGNTCNHENVVHTETSGNRTRKKRKRKKDFSGMVCDMASAEENEAHFNFCHGTDTICHEPKIGNRIQIRCPVKDLFVKHSVQVWVSGCVVNVERKKKCDGDDRDGDEDLECRYWLTIRTIDGNHIHSWYPDSSVRMVSTSWQGGELLLDDYENPTKLYLGDHVEARHQSKDEWRNGRVSHISKCGNYLDISYFNGWVSEMSMYSVLRIVFILSVSLNAEHFVYVLHMIV